MSDKEGKEVQGGDAAYPVIESVLWEPSEYGADVKTKGGLTKREYFVAHAPAEPAPWFNPVVAPFPPLAAHLRFCQSCKDGMVCDGTANCQEITEWRKGNEKWAANFNKQKYIRWPIAWADEMIAALKGE